MKNYYFFISVILLIFNSGYSQISSNPHAQIDKEFLNSKLETVSLVDLTQNVELNSLVENFGNPPQVNWIHHFGGSGNDYAHAVCADNNGNVFITGQFTGNVIPGGNTYTSVGIRDGFLAKYTSEGNISWFKQMQAAEEGDLIVYSMTTDGDAIFIAGRFTGSIQIEETTLAGNSESSMFFAKFSNSGDLIFAKSYQSGGPATGKKISLDDSGAIYILVNKSNTNSTRDAAVILKYTSDGSFLWQKEPTDSEYITICDMAVSGDSIVWTGAIQGSSGGDSFEKYLDADVILNTPIDRVQDVYIAKSDLNADFKWAQMAHHGSETGGDSWDSYITTDSDDNIFLTGYFRKNISFGDSSITYYNGGFTAKFNSSGIVQWLNMESNAAKYPVTDENGNCYFHFNNSIHKYDSNGTQVYYIIGSWDITTYAINISPQGKLLQAGAMNGLISLAQFNDTGDKEWSDFVDGNSGSVSTFGMVVDNQANSYIYGSSINKSVYNGTELSNGIFVAKQDKDGAVLWIKQMEANIKSSGIGNQICLDTLNQVIYIVLELKEDCILPDGTKLFVGIPWPLLIVKYDFEGNYLGYILEPSYIFRPSLIVDKEGNLILTGVFGGTIEIGTYEFSSFGNDDCIIVKYDPSGKLLWAKQAGGEYIESAIIATTFNNKIYLIGEFLSRNITIGNVSKTYEPGDGIIIFAEMEPDGTVNSMKLLGSGENEYDCWPTGIISDKDGNIFIKGWQGDSVRFDDIILTSPYYYYSYFLAKLDYQGNVLWAHSIWENMYGFDSNQFSTDNEGNVYLGAQSKDSIRFENVFAFKPENKSDLFLAKYDASGTLNWVQTIQSNGNWGNISSVIAYENSNVFVCGDFSNQLYFGTATAYASNVHGFSTLMGEGIVGVKEIYNNQNLDDISIYPNPTKGVVSINMPDSMVSNLTIYNVLGEQVFRVDEVTNGAEMNLDFLELGVYYFQFENSSKAFKVLVIE